MFSLRCLIISMLLCFSVNAQADEIQLKDEGTSQGYVSILNFTGAGATCTKSGRTGTCDVTSGGGSGTMTTVKENDVAVGGADIVTIDFLGADFNLTESPDKEIQIVIEDSGIDHDATTNFSATEHVAEASISHDTIADVSTSDHHTQVVSEVNKDIVTTAPITGGEDNVLPGADADLTIAVSAASTSASGVAELATTAEINTGTDTGRVMGVDEFQASDRNMRHIALRTIEQATDVTATADQFGDFVSSIAGVIQQSDTTKEFLSAACDTAGTTGTMVVDIHLNGTTIMTTNKLDIETTEKSTTTATTQPDLTTTAIAIGNIITIDIDAIHTTACKGLTVYMTILED